MNQNNNSSYIGPGTKLPETTIKAIILGFLLSAVLSGANAYLGLFAGMTVSASIPAAVISMAIFQLFKKHNILENNIVQTAASAGESLAAGVVFTFPALILMGYWEAFNYLETLAISLCGGILGVMFTIPLRSALIVKQKLRFPEGIATSEVLKSGRESGKSTKHLIVGGLVGAGMKIVNEGLKIWHAIFEKAAFVGQKAYLYFGLNLSPALVGVGYIVGVRISILVFLGGVISWWVAIPIYLATTGNPGNVDAVKLGYDLWSNQIRYLGVGAMVVGGLWALINMRNSITSAITEGVQAIKDQRKGIKRLVRTETDISMNYVLLTIVLLIIPIFILYMNEIGIISISALMTLIMIIAGFLFSAVAAYMGGLVGSSNNPISGVTIATILMTSLILFGIMGEGGVDKGPAAAVMIGAIVCCAASIGGDNMQDLKAGYILGATPKRQQIMQVIGVVSAALVLPVILQLLNDAYGFGPKTEAHPNALPAPQATLMRSVAEGVFGGDLPWNMVFIGMGIGAAIIITDKILEYKQIAFRMPVLAVAVGLYLPFELDSAIMLGGIVAWLVNRYQKRHAKKSQDSQEQATNTANRSGVLVASGLITGEALIGILLAIPIVILENATFMQVLSSPISAYFGLIILLGICYLIYRTVIKSFRTH